MNSRFLTILGGAMLVAGTAIGAGMLALPMISAGMWFYWSVVLLLISWFCMFRSGMISHIRLDVLLDVQGGGGQAIYIWGAVSTYLTSFCFHASVPSLIKYLGKEPRTINACLRYGTLIALACYLSWIVAADGNISREQFREVIASGGNVGHMVAAAGNSLSGIVMRLLEAFSLLAVATSFLGAGLGLFDYMADLCNFDDSRLGRAKTLLITFAPPMFCGLIWPDGFLPAIGWAGLAASIWSVIVPALLLRAGRRRFAARGYAAPGGALLIPMLLLYGSLVAVCHTLFVFKLLPMYP